MSEWAGFCSNRDCSCFAPDGYVCDEFKGDGRSYRCHECGWPDPIHDLRDRMAGAGLRLVLSADRIRRAAEETE